MVIWNTALRYWARRLLVPYKRLYDATTSRGLSQITNQRTLEEVVFTMQRNAVPFKALSDVFGTETTLGELARKEARQRAVASGDR